MNNNYKSNLGGYDNQFDSDDDDDFSDQNQVQKFNSENEFERSYNKGGHVKDDEVMVDDEGLMHGQQPNGMPGYGVGYKNHQQKRSGMKQKTGYFEQH